ncbi:hypothetical protein HOE04_01780 [archaeon]|jgi:hypothetical protein|nr:hypothetical protein [archaeon]
MVNKKIIGGIFIFVGLLVIILQPLVGITGAVVGSAVSIEINFMIGLVVLVLGIVLYATGLQELIKSDSDIKDFGVTREFKRATKGMDKKIIRRAVKKIGTGLGHEKHRMYGDENFSVRVDKGGRIFYQIMPNGSILLNEYVPPSRHH